jgi:hypothetical protein
MPLWSGWPWKRRDGAEVHTPSTFSLETDGSTPMSFSDIDDTTLGHLTWEAEMDWWSCNVELHPGSPIEFCVSATAADGLRPVALIQSGHDALVLIQRQEEEIKLATAEQLLDLHNEAWNEGDPIDRATFASRMKIESIIAYPDGTTEITYDDGNLFLGHTIFVGLDREGAVTGASFQG